MSVLDVFDRWLGREPDVPRGPRWFRRHGLKREDYTAHATAPKSGARLRRYREERRRGARRLRRVIVAAAGRSGTQRAS